MKNLELLNVKRFKISDTLQNVMTITVNEDTVFALNENFLYSYDLKTGVDRQLSDNQYNCITPLVFLTFQNQLWFGTGEEMVFYSPDTGEINTIPMPTKFDAAVWNPTEECLLVVFSDGHIGVYTFDLDDYTTYCAGNSHLEAAVPQSVYVGWGSEKTQFRGSEGKLALKKTVEEKSIPVDDKVPQVSWRGNGEMFVVNYWHDQIRTFKVFEYPCKPAYKVEAINGLQAIIAWRPTGNMIACPVYTDNKCSIVIFEKNGCKRFGFDLIDSAEIKNITWSQNGKILAVHQTIDGVDVINLYSTSNYKWYLKQKLQFAPKNPLISFDFIGTSKDLLALRVFTKQKIVLYTFRFTIHRSISNSDAFTACAVIDGSNTLITLFGKENCPPPMSNILVQSESSINFLAFHTSKSLLAIIDSKHNVLVFDYKSQKSCSRFKIEDDAEIFIPLLLHHFYWSNNQLTYLKSVNDTLDDLSVFAINPDGTNDFEFLNTITSDLNEIIVLPNGTTEVISYANKICVKTDGVINFEETFESMPLITNAIQIEQSTYVFSLTQTNKFFINDKYVTNKVTSFLIHDNRYLLLTTNENQLYCIRLNPKQIEILFKTSDLDASFYSRSVEQSASLICAVSDSSDVVLQMPRGNIEIISCRLIAVDRLECMLKKNEWEKALYFIRTERLNINLLIDLNPNRFIKNVNKFVEATKSPAVLNAFSQEITNENVLYENYSKCAIESVDKVENKRQVICGMILDYLEKQNYTNYITPIIMICIQHFTIERALVYLQDLLKRSETDKNLEEFSKMAIHTLKTYVNEDVLYKKSLMLYDIDLAWFVARNCQMDPCEYEPFLLKLKSLSEIEQRYEINVLMEKPEIAIKYLVRMPNVKDETVLNFIQKHNVSHIVYDFIPTSSLLFVELSKLYAKKLHDKRKFNEAASIYARSNLWLEALKEYVLALNWKRAMFAMNKLNLRLEERKSYVNNLSENLIKNDKVIEAGQLYEECLQDYESSVKILNDNACFTDAIRIAQKYNRTDIIEKDIADAMKSHGKALVSKIKDNQVTFHKHFSRLQIVRDEKIQRYKNEIFNSIDCTSSNRRLEDADIYSDTESRSTRSTGSHRTTVSVRNLRRRQAKIENVREGGVYEDIALLRALHILIVEICKLGHEIGEFCLLCLEQEGMFADVRFLHNLLVNLQNDVNTRIPEIWQTYLAEEIRSDAPIEEVALCENVSLLDVQYRTPPKEINLSSWRLTIFEGV